MAETKYKVGIEGAYPPFNTKDASGNVVGFDKDIAMALCAKMKAECEVVTSDWDGIIPALNAKKFDFIVSSLSITDERKQAVDFTDPYYSNKQQFIALPKGRLQNRHRLPQRQDTRHPARDPGRHLAGRQTRW
jgi:putative lysine/arginine/ornithine/histidine/octopine transport system substrate-binding protein